MPPLPAPKPTTGALQTRSLAGASARPPLCKIAGRHVSVLCAIGVLLSFADSRLLSKNPVAEPTSDEILVKASEVIEKGQAAAYSSTREYRLRNFRFGKEAVVVAQLTYNPDTGKDFTILQRSGSPKLVEIVEKLFASEIEVSRPAAFATIELSPANYRARLRGVDNAEGRACFAIDLIPKRKSKYLIKGTAWVDRESYGLVRIEGTTSASVSMWIGSPHISQQFAQIGGLWLPTHTGSVSSGFLLGPSELEIQYTDYLIMDTDHGSPNRIATDGLPHVRQ